MKREKVFVAKPFPSIPTIAEMDAANDALRVELCLLRCLCTSDLAFRYMLLRADSVRDIARTSLSLLDDEAPSHPNAKRAGLTDAEREEYITLCNQLGDYARVVDSAEQKEGSA